MKDTLKIISGNKNYAENSKKYEQNVAMIYKVSKDMLLKSNINYHFDGQMMGIFDDNIEKLENVKRICEDILYEYNMRKFKGIYLDFEYRNSVELVSKLDELAFNQNISLYVPHKYVNNVKYASIVIDMCIGGGDIKNILEYAQMKYTSKRVSARISHNILKFYVPSDNRVEKVLESIDLRNKEVFFSKPLCANYYTKMIDERQCEFFMFDDEKSFYKKMEILKELLIKDIFITSNDIEKYNI